MSTSFRLIRTFAVGVVMGVGVAGCGDVVTHSKQAKKAGMAELSAGNYADAAGSFTNATRQNPRDYESYYWMGVAYDRLGSYQQSMRALRTSLSTMRETLEGRNNRTFRLKVLDALAIVTSKSADRQAQVTALEDRIKGRETAEDLFLVAKIHRYGSDPDAAIEAYNRAALLDPKDYDILKEYALYLEQLGQTERAQPLLVRAYKMREDDQQVADALRRMGVVPGISLRDEGELAQPSVPKGPLPEIELTPMGNSSAGRTGPRD